MARQQRYPGFGADDNQYDDPTAPTADDPYSALQALLTGAGSEREVPSTPATPAVATGASAAAYPSAGSGLGSRNSAVAGAIRKQYGLGPDDGSISQSDLESLDSFVRSGNVNEALGKTMPVIDAKAAADATLERAKAVDALNLENTKGKYALEGEAMKGQTARDVAKLKEGAFGGGDAASNPIIDFWAEQAKNDSSLLAKLPAAAKDAVAARMAQMGGTVETMTNQTRQMSEAANDLLPMIDSIQQRAAALQGKGAFDLVGSPIRQFLVRHGASSLEPGVADEAGRFETDLGLLQSGVARAHAGARGAGNTEMAARFEKLMNAQGDLPTFLSQLNGVRDLLSIYARHTNPNIAASDPYSNPDYQPR